MSAELSGRWLPEVATRLGELLTSGLERHRCEPDAQHPPVAVFDFDNTCIQNDIGEAFHRYMATELLYDLDGEFLAQLHPDDGRERIASLWAAHKTSPDDEAVRSALRLAIIAAYDRHMAREGKGPTYQWQVTLLAGLHEAQVDAAARGCIEAALREPLGRERVALEDGLRVELCYGVRRYPEIEALMRLLERHGVEVWICSASSRWIVAPLAERFGIPAERVLSAEVEVDAVTRRLSARSMRPHAFSAGKVELIDQRIGYRPLLCVGDSMTDLEMLQASRGEVLVIDRGDVALREIADEAGWLVQPAFHLVG